MRKTIVCIFAHPDDEAFGPSGTIAKLAKEHDVYLLCATKGQAGKDSGTSKRSLHERRAEELRKSASILGVKKVYFLGFVDGMLSNNLYHAMAKKIEAKLKLFKPEMLLTFGPTGISGYIDHITVSLVSSYVFYRMPFVKTIWQTVMTKERSDTFGQKYFVYFPPGIPRAEVDKIMDVSDVWETKLQAMYCHRSQKHDYERILKLSEDFPKEEYFTVINK